MPDTCDGKISILELQQSKTSARTSIYSVYLYGKYLTLSGNSHCAKRMRWISIYRLWSTAQHNKLFTEAETSLENGMVLLLVGSISYTLIG